MLWERGEVVAALELESLWNTAIVKHPIRLLCAYPGELLAGADLGDVARMCGLHDHVSLVGAHPGAGEMPTGDDAALSSVHLPVPAAVASVRRFVREALAGWGLDDLVGDVTLVTSELATNAITHGSSPFRTSLVRADGVVRVAVEDGSMAWPAAARRPTGRPGRPGHGDRRDALAPVRVPLHPARQGRVGRAERLTSQPSGGSVTTWPA